jgi:hypothetical protein
MENSMNTEIATLTEKQLCALEDKVKRGSAAFVEVGKALAQIREGKGYKLRGFATFEDYCEKMFGITDRHGRRLIQATETSATVEKITGQMPGSESVARELTSIAGDQKKVEKVAAILEKRGYSVVTATAEAVKEAVSRVNAPRPAAAPGNGKAVIVETNGHGKGKSAEPVDKKNYPVSVARQRVMHQNPSLSRTR